MLHKFTKIMTIYYTVLEKPRVTDVIFIFPFGLFFALMTQKSKSLKNEKMPHYDHMMYSSWDIVFHGWTDRRTDRLMKKSDI